MKRNLIYYGLITITAISCSNDSNVMFDVEDPHSLFNDELSIINYSDSNYLDLDCYVQSKLTENDFYIIDKAELRMGIDINDDGLYYKCVATAVDLNIAPELYDLIWNNYSYANQKIISVTNQIKNKSKKNKRSLSKNPEGSNTLGDCVPISISYCSGRDYNYVVALCDYVDPQWRTRGGVDLSHAAGIMRGAGCTNVNTFYSGSAVEDEYGDDNVSINAMLVYANSSPTGYHAVNAYQYLGSASQKIVLYNDHQSKRYGYWIWCGSIDCMFVCD